MTIACCSAGQNRRAKSSIAREIKVVANIGRLSPLLNLNPSGANAARRALLPVRRLAVRVVSFRRRDFF
jgi:hypothetical protein